MTSIRKGGDGSYGGFNDGGKGDHGKGDSGKGDYGKGDYGKGDGKTRRSCFENVVFL